MKQSNTSTYKSSYFFCFLLQILLLSGLKATPPSVSALLPLHLATNIPANTPLNLTFDQVIKKGTGNILVKDFSTLSLIFSIPVSCTCLTILGNTATLTLPANLSNNQTVYIEIQAGAFQNLANEPFAGISGTNVWRFSTANGLITHQLFAPLSNAGCVSLQTSLQITFSTNVIAGNGKIYIYEKATNVLSEQILAISSQVLIVANVGTINLQNILNPHTQYYVLIDSDAFITGFGAVYEGITNNTTWTFTTTESPPIASDATYCGSGQVLLQANSLASGASFNWYNSAVGGTLLQMGASFQTPVLNTSTNYYVTTIVAGCESVRKPIKAIILPLPLVNLAQRIQLQKGESVVLQANGGIQYRWTPTDGLSNPEVANPVALPQQSIVYTVIVTNAQNCSTQAQVDVQVREGVNEVFLPNTFSPDQNGKNDRFRVKGKNISSVDLKVYNRTGILLYQSQSLQDATQNGWDGTFQGNLQPSDTYIWRISGSYTDGTEISVGQKNTGTLFLLR
jgi:gliding motility-associated-like protein